MNLPDIPFVVWLVTLIVASVLLIVAVYQHDARIVDAAKRDRRD